MKRQEKLIIGWREWIALPCLHIPKIKAKVDTGARTSSLHAFDLKYTSRKKIDYVSFKVRPIQKDSTTTIQCTSRVIEYRKVKSSNGQIEKRPVIIIQAILHELKLPIEVTLTNRDQMGFRMLLGRAAMKELFIVDPGKSYYSKKL